MRSKRRAGEPSVSLILYALFFVFLAFYVLFTNVLFGALTVLLLAIIIGFEVRASLGSVGAEKTLLDIGTAVGAAIAIYLVLIFLVLHTPTPIDAVSSCSMLPTLHRGDLVILHGIGNMSAFIASTHVPVVNVTRAEFAGMQSSMQGEFLAYFAYFNGNMSSIASAFPQDAQYGVGLYSTTCLSQYGYLGRQSLYYRCYAADQSQAGNLIRYSYSIGTLNASNRTLAAIYTSAITADGAAIAENYSNPIIVYRTTSQDVFSGSVIHRLYALLNVSGTYYFLTKGDNNQALDIEYGNYPANQSAVLGYVVADIPVLGYLKLLVSGQLAQPAGCNEVFSPH